MPLDSNLFLALESRIVLYAIDDRLDEYHAYLISLVILEVIAGRPNPKYKARLSEKAGLVRIRKTDCAPRNPNPKLTGTILPRGLHRS